MKKYSITFGKEKKAQNANPDEQNKSEILVNNVVLFEDFIVNDYNSNLTIGNIKEFFLENFAYKYKYCKCMLSLYYKISAYFGQNKFRLLSNNDSTKINEFKYDKLFLIRTKTKCNCEYKEYRSYMNMSKFNLIKKLKDSLDKTSKLEQLNKIKGLNNEKNEIEIERLIRQNLELKNKIKKMEKTEDIKYPNKPKPEDFYDIIIDINSIINVNKEGWKVKFSEEGLEKYKKFKDNELFTIGVLGEVNKGKTFILEKLSKIKLLTGVHTEGLSLKYPDLKGYAGRQIILIDSGGFKSPLLIKFNKEKDKYNFEEKKINDNMETNDEFDEKK